VLFADRKSHIGFQLLLKSVTLNDLEQHYGDYFVLINAVSISVVDELLICVGCMKHCGVGHYL